MKIPNYFIFLVLIMCASQLSCLATTAPSSTESTNTLQMIDYFMQEAPLDGQSIVSYTNVLGVGEKVTGYIQLIGEWELSGDWAHPWEFFALDPNGEVLDHTIVIYDKLGTDPVHYFEFTTSIQGIYTLEVIHISVFPRDMHIEIQPSGWELGVH